MNLVKQVYIKYHLLKALDVTCEHITWVDDDGYGRPEALHEEVNKFLRGEVTWEFDPNLELIIVSTKRREGKNR